MSEKEEDKKDDKEKEKDAAASTESSSTESTAQSTSTENSSGTTTSGSGENALTTTRHRGFNININNQPEMVEYEYDAILPSGKILALYQTIKNALPDQRCHVIQFASAYQGEGTNLISFETAYTAATQIGLRVLFIDTADHEKHLRHELAIHVDTTLDVLLQAGGQLEVSQVGIEKTHFVYTLLRNPRFKDSALANLDSFDELLKVLRGMYDLIIIPSPGILSDILCASLSKLVDGTIIIVEAERTRAPVATQLKDLILQNSGKPIGTIMNKRRFYIPQIFYRWI